MKAVDIIFINPDQDWDSFRNMNMRFDKFTLIKKKKLIFFENNIILIFIQMISSFGLP